SGGGGYSGAVGLPPYRNFLPGRGRGAAAQDRVASRRAAGRSHRHSDVPAGARGEEAGYGDPRWGRGRRDPRRLSLPSRPVARSPAGSLASSPGSARGPGAGFGAHTRFGPQSGLRLSGEAGSSGQTESPGLPAAARSAVAPRRVSSPDLVVRRSGHHIVVHVRLSFVAERPSSDQSVAAGAGQRCAVPQPNHRSPVPRLVAGRHPDEAGQALNGERDRSEGAVPRLSTGRVPPAGAAPAQDSRVVEQTPVTGLCRTVFTGFRGRSAQNALLRAAGELSGSRPVPGSRRGHAARPRGAGSRALPARSGARPARRAAAGGVSGGEA